VSSNRSVGQIMAYGAEAGGLAAMAYLGAMEIDIALTHYPSSDLQVIEGLARGRSSRVPWVGVLGHLANGAGLGIIYAVVQRWLPGPAWLRGILFSEGFILLAWPTTPLLDRFHPLIRRGQLPPFARRTAFAQNLSRHLVFGLVLGESLRLLKQRGSGQR
jgi:Family of unknown function (DUF6789)